VLQKEDTYWVKKCMTFEVEGSRPRGRPKRTWRESCTKKIVNHINGIGMMLWIGVDGRS